MDICNNNFLNSLDEIPVWSSSGNKLICTDQKTGRVLKESLAPSLPDGTKLEFFIPYKAVIVKEINIHVDNMPSYLNEISFNTFVEDYELFNVLSIGTEIYVSITPNGVFYLSHSSTKTAMIGMHVDLSDITLIEKGR